MYGARVVNEVAAGGGVAHEEFRWEHVRLEAIARRTRGNDVACDVRAAFGERMDVVERRAREVKRLGAVHAPPAAVAHRGELERSLLLGGLEASNAAKDSARRT